MSTQRKSKKAEIEAEVEIFDWSLVDAASDKEIEDAAKSDPDIALLSEADLVEADLVLPPRARRKSKQAAG